MALPFVQAQLVSRELLTPFLGIFTFSSDSPITFKSGQFLTVGITHPRLEGPGVMFQQNMNIVWRPYSVASAPGDNYIELLISWVRQDGKRRDEWGTLTTELFNPDPDIRYFFRKKAKGVFLLPEDDRDVIMVAAGTGIAPFMSMLRNAQTEGDRRRFVLIHGSSSREGLAYRGELQQDFHLGLTYLCAVSREEGGDFGKRYVEDFFLNRPGDSGRLTAEETASLIRSGAASETKIEQILGIPPDPRRFVMMLCGNAGMIGNVKAIASSCGFTFRKDLFTEEYW
ncbi:hypothetical protein ACFL6L_02805 [candidate division KSB1 bacterium]